jgi:hypothetical protein
VSVLVLDESQQYSSSTAAGTGGSSTVKSTGEEGSDVVTLKPARSRVRFQLGDDLTEMSGTTEVTPRKSDWHKDNTPSKSALVAVPTDADATATGTTLKEQGLASVSGVLQQASIEWFRPAYMYLPGCMTGAHRYVLPCAGLGLAFQQAGLMVP